MTSARVSFSQASAIGSAPWIGGSGAQRLGQDVRAFPLRQDAESETPTEPVVTRDRALTWLNETHTKPGVR